MFRRAIKTYETKSGDPFFVFKHSERWITFDKPFCLGFIVLELAKLYIHEPIMIYNNLIIVKTT